MANLKLAKSEDELKNMKISDIKKSYIEIGSNYNKMIDGDLLKCPKCGDIMNAETAFYSDINYVTNRYPICKRCIQMMVEQKKNKRDEPNETKESVQNVLRMMNRVYDDNFYDKCVKGAQDGLKEKNRSSPFATYITATSSLPQWKNKTWSDSIFSSDDIENLEEDVKIIQKTVNRGKKTFGKGYSPEDYMALMDLYDDWCQRTKVDSLSQETYVKQICLQLLDIDKDRKDGKDVTNKLKALDTLMNSANLQPRQNVSNAATDALTFSQLIAKWEESSPIPMPEDDLKDESGISRNIRVWFSGWLANALGLNTPQSQEYLDEVEKYTVRKPEIKEEETESSTYKKIFGSGD